MGRNTRQTNPIEELQTCSDERAIHNKFRSTAFSRSVQAKFVRPVFDAVVSKHIPMVILPSIQELKTESAAALPDPEASLETQKSFVSPSTSDVIRTGSLYWYQYQSRHSKTSKVESSSWLKVLPDLF